MWEDGKIGMKAIHYFAVWMTVSAVISPGAFDGDQPVPLDPVLLSGDFWTKSAAGIGAELQPLGFVSTSAAGDSLRAAHKGLTFGGLRIYEAIVRFREERANEVTLIFYNRGDAGEVGQDAFESMIREIPVTLSGLFGAQAKERGRDASSAVRADGLVWDGPSRSATLEWSFVRESRAKNIPFRSEFIRLSLTPPGAHLAPMVGASPPPKTKDIVKAFSGQDKVQKAEGGDVFLGGVPMVDQGQKGYCVVASVERVMRYFGTSVDQHELAQIANTRTEGGTSPAAMVDSLKKLTMRLGVRVKEAVPFDFRDFLRMIEDYNRAAKRAKEPEVKLGGRVVDISACYQQMKPEIFREVRLKKSADFHRFQREIQDSITEGIPLLWSVQLGVVPEPEIPQAAGGHMRLVIGFNPQSREILYSDSWGLGHEMKRMSAEDAWVITSGLSIIQPAGT